MKKILIPVLLFLNACAPSSQEDFRCEGEAQTKALAAELSRINSVEDLRAALPRLRKRYLKIAELAQAARAFRETHPEIEPSSPSQASEKLFAELARLYELPGGREILESAQEEAVQKLTR